MIEEDIDLDWRIRSTGGFLDAVKMDVESSIPERSIVKFWLLPNIELFS